MLQDCIKQIIYHCLEKTVREKAELV